jgi:hypothetical protein
MGILPASSLLIFFEFAGVDREQAERSSGNAAKQAAFCCRPTIKSTAVGILRGRGGKMGRVASEPSPNRESEGGAKTQ